MAPLIQKGNLTARMNYAWNANNVTKLQAPWHSMLQLEQDYQGTDYSIKLLKLINPSPVENTGIFILSYFNLKIYREQIALQPYNGRKSVLYRHHTIKISEKVDFGTELQILVASGRREAVCTVGGKFDFRAATFRGQIDTTGRISSVIEQKIAPGFSFIITGDIEHMKSTARFGVGIQLEA
ncbi:unnamed protein product [Rhizophagus irregularis]|nr:unnamed protein product [Rhizophagus irregularis]